MSAFATNYQPFRKTSNKTPTKSTKRDPLTPRSNNQMNLSNFREKPTQLKGMVSSQLETKQQFKREKSFNILNYLDKKQPTVLHKYKKFQNHTKSSDVNQVREIILELLNKHAIERKLSPSEQYILTGYFVRYIDFANTSPRLTRNPFNIVNRIHTNNSPDMVTQPHIEAQSPRKSVSRAKTPKYKNKNPLEQKREQLKKQLEMVKFLWQIYLLKCITCPSLNKLSSAEDTENRRELLDMFSKLKGIQQKRGKIGEEKAMMELGKIMKRFQVKICSCLG